MSTTKIGENTTNISKLVFSQYIYTSSHQTKYLHIENWICLPQAEFFCLTSRNAKKNTQTDQSSSYKKRPTNLQKWHLQKVFSSVYVIGTTCFGKCFPFYVITERHYFSWKFIVTLKLLSAILLLLNQCFERSTYFMRFLHDNNMMLIPEFQNKAIMFLHFPN